MSEPITFTVFGEAKPAGSKRAFRHPTTGQTIVTDSSGKKGKDWRRAVADVGAEVAPPELLRGPLTVQMTFYRPRPKGHRRTGRNAHLLRDSAPPYPTTRPDVLKLARAAEDALTSVLWADDAQIVDEHLVKLFGEPARLEVVVTQMDGSELDAPALAVAA